MTPKKWHLSSSYSTPPPKNLAKIPVFDPFLDRFWTGPNPYPQKPKSLNVQERGKITKPPKPPKTGQKRGSKNDPKMTRFWGPPILARTPKNPQKTEKNPKKPKKTRFFSKKYKGIWQNISKNEKNDKKSKKRGYRLKPTYEDFKTPGFWQVGVSKTPRNPLQKKWLKRKKRKKRAKNRKIVDIGLEVYLRFQNSGFLTGWVIFGPFWSKWSKNIKNSMFKKIHEKYQTEKTGKIMTKKTM